MWSDPSSTRIPGGRGGDSRGPAARLPESTCASHVTPLNPGVRIHSIGVAAVPALCQRGWHTGHPQGAWPQRALQVQFRQPTDPSCSSPGGLPTGSTGVRPTRPAAVTQWTDPHGTPARCLGQFWKQCWNSSHGTWGR